MAARVISARYLFDFSPWSQVVSFYFIINDFLSSLRGLKRSEGEKKIIGKKWREVESFVYSHRSGSIADFVNLPREHSLSSEAFEEELAFV